MNIEEHLQFLKGVTCPEELFGDFLPGIIHKYRTIAGMIHPDRNNNSVFATEAFQLLEKWKQVAEKKIKAGTYGNRTILDEPIIISSKDVQYVLTQIQKPHPVYEEYRGTDVSGSHEIICKITRSPKNNDLLNNEAKILAYLRDSAPTKDLEAMAHIPQYVESLVLFQNKERRQVNIMRAGDHFYTLQDVINKYPDGLDPRDAAWMFNRMIGSLVIAHQAGVVNAGVLPNQFVINAKSHNGILKDWMYAVDLNSSKKVISAIDNNYREYYPEEIFNKVPATFGMDIYMAALCLLKLLGGDVKTKTLPSRVLAPIQGLIRACLLSPSKRITDIWQLHDDFNNVLNRLFGPKKYRILDMGDK